MQEKLFRYSLNISEVVFFVSAMHSFVVQKESTSILNLQNALAQDYSAVKDLSFSGFRVMDMHSFMPAVRLSNAIWNRGKRCGLIQDAWLHWLQLLITISSSSAVSEMSSSAEKGYFMQSSQVRERYTCRVFHSPAWQTGSFPHPDGAVAVKRAGE
jgi:hypothetical protein